MALRPASLMIARLAHARGLAIGLKNDIDQVRRLEPDFDFAVNEQCVQYDECAPYAAFISADKPVFHVEYSLTRSRFCARAERIGLSPIRKRLSLRVWRRAC
jgi:hypothetical protein